MDKFLSEHQQEDNPQNVAQVPQLSPTSIPLSHLQDLAQDHQPVELSQQCLVNVEWTELALAMVMDTLSPMRGCFARGSVVSLSCVGFDTGPNAGKKDAVSNSTVGCDEASTGVCPTCSICESGCFSSHS